METSAALSLVPSSQEPGQIIPFDTGDVISYRRAGNEMVKKEPSFSRPRLYQYSEKDHRDICAYDAGKVVVPMDEESTGRLINIYA